MKKAKQDTTTGIQEKVHTFADETKSLLEPQQLWDYLHTKLDDFQASDVENKFVTISAVMNLVSALIQIVFGLWLKSMSVVSSAIDSLLDFAL
ncbi:MAG: hypothetical protein H6765_11335 [Candidatus Peribacteria bacterium]|nr:MAG: hypothetical protein H6765_11335 [Candidatus Peribacteria bacterium]